MSKGKKSKAAASDTVNYEGLLKEQLKDVSNTLIMHIICFWQEKWQPFIILLVPDNLSSLPAHQSIVSAIETKCRRRFVSLDKESVFTTVSGSLCMCVCVCMISMSFFRQKKMLNSYQLVLQGVEEERVSKVLQYCQSHYILRYVTRS